MKTITNKGFFKPKNPKKYKGQSTNIVWRSSWERKCMDFFDRSPNIISWQSEERAIAYRSVDGKIRRYFPDFIIETINPKSKIIQTIMIEVKPKSQTLPPKEPKELSSNKKKRYLREVLTYGQNKAKWEAADFFCKKRGWKFQILTEDHIFGPKYKKNY